MEVCHQVALTFLRQFPDLGSLCSDSCEVELILGMIAIIAFVDFGDNMVEGSHFQVSQFQLPGVTPSGQGREWTEDSHYKLEKQDKDGMWSVVWRTKMIEGRI